MKLDWQRQVGGDTWKLPAPMQHVALVNYTKTLFDGWRICWGGSIIGPKFKTLKTALSRAHLTLKPMLRDEANRMEQEARDMIVAAATIRKMLS